MLVFYPVAIAISRFNSQFWLQQQRCHLTNSHALYAYFQHTRTQCINNKHDKGAKEKKKQYGQSDTNTELSKIRLLLKIRCNFQQITANFNLFSAIRVVFTNNYYFSRCYFAGWYFSLDFFYFCFVVERSHKYVI